MAEKFDPYRKWLGIPPQEQPPHYYRLLGVGLFEDDPDVIQEAADRQMAHVQTHKTGKYSDLSQKLLNELAKAKLCLLSPDKKAEYDKQLKAKLKAKSGTSDVAVAKAAPAKATPVAAAGKPAARKPTKKAAAKQKSAPVIVAEDTHSPAYRARRRGVDWQMYGIIGGVAIAGMVAVGFLLMSQPPATDMAEATTPEKSEETLPPEADPKAEESDEQPNDGPLKLPASEPEPKLTLPGPDDTQPVSTDRPSSDTPKTEPDKQPGSEPDTKGDKPVAPSEPSTPEPVAGSEPPEEPVPEGIIRRRRPFGGRVDLSDLVASLDEPESAAPAPPVAEIVEVQKKSPVPADSARQDAAAEIHEIYQAEYENAKSSSAKVILAAKLHSLAANTRDDAAAQFALLTEARDLALAAGNISTAMKRVDSLAKLFEIDPLSEKVSLLRRGEDELTGRDAQRAVSAHALVLIEQAVMANDFKQANELLEIGLSAARKARDGDLVKVSATLRDELTLLQKRHAEFEEHLARLEANPADTEAKTAAGRYYCFILGDWKTGLPLLAAGQDSTLAGAASRDVTSSEDPVEQAAIGDGWWDLAETVPEIESPAVQERATYWYRRAVPQLSGFTKTKVEKRLESIVAASQKAVDAIDPSKIEKELPKYAQEFIGRYVLVATDTKTRQVVSTIWDFNEDRTATENGHRVARWEPADGARIKVVMIDSDNDEVYLRVRGKQVSGTRTVDGQRWKWELTPLAVVGVWEHTSSYVSFRDRERRERTEMLTFYSNGRVNDPLGPITWAIQGRTLTIIWDESKRTVATIAPGNKAYVGKTTLPLGFGDLKRTVEVTGKLVNMSGDQ